MLAPAGTTVRVAGTDRQDSTLGPTHLGVSALSGSGSETIARIVSAAGGVGVGMSGAGQKTVG